MYGSVEATGATHSPRKVEVSYKINCISHIDSVTSTFYVDLKLFYHWTDPNFIGRKKNEQVDIKKEGSWNPDIIISNEHQLTSIEAHREVRVNNSKTGEIKSSVQYRGTLFINASRVHVICARFELTVFTFIYTIGTEHGPINVSG